MSRYGKEFEILLDYEKLKEWREGKAELRDVLVTPGIFRGIRKAKIDGDRQIRFGDKEGAVEKYDNETLQQVFGTTDYLAIAERIIREGEVQYTTEQRREMLEAKRKQIANLISRQSVDPRTGAPHTPSRIEAAMEQAKVKIDIEKPAEAQVQEVIAKIRPLLPLRIETKRVVFSVPIQYAGRVKAELRKLATIKSENWTGTGATFRVEFGAGIEEQVYNVVNRITHGEATSREE